MSELIPAATEFKERLLQLALDGLVSPHTRRAYRTALDEFLTWAQYQQPSTLSKALVQRYKTMVIAKELAPATINQRLAAVRRLAQEAADNGLIDGVVAAAISKVRGVPQHGVRIGRWLTVASARAILAAPAADTIRGKRDRAVLSILLGCGLRRSEVTAIDIRQFRIVEDRWVIADLVGKHGRVRTVPVPAFAKIAVDDWCAAAGITSGCLLRQISRREVVREDGLTDQAVYDIVLEAARTVDPYVRPHDLRRSFARLAYEGHAAIEQLALALGHASVHTTERYVAAKQHFRVAPCDVLGLDLPDSTSVAG